MKANPALTTSYDLEERTAAFGEKVIVICRLLPLSPITSPLITQFVKSGTSIGANYCEADEAESKPDFRHKIAICCKEANETKYWCRMMASACPTQTERLRSLWQEAHELHIIFCKIIRTTDANLQSERLLTKRL